MSRSDAALARWRGAPYADCADTEWVRAEVERVGELRLSLIEARSAALLTLGHPDRVAAEVRPLAEQHPFREHLWSLLALAQYQTLRQADALATLRTLRARLDEDLGVDPSPEVQRLEQDLLQQSPELAAAARVELSSAASAPPATVRGPELVGRIDSLRTLSNAVDRLLAGIGGTVIISGEAGIGKSRLAASAAAAAESRGIRVLVGRCHEADVAPAYWPWLPVLRELADESAPAEVMALLGTDSGVEPIDAGAAALRTYDAVTRLIGAAARRRPLLVILEDLHWADTSSLRLLSYAAESLDAPVLIIATRRTADVRVSEALTSALAGLARNGAERIRLDGLGPAEVSELLSREIDDPAPALADVVTARTEGNPFFVLELGRLLRARGITDAAEAAQIAVPEGIADVLRLRLGRLEPHARKILAIAAVAGRAVDPRLIMTVSGTSMAGGAGRPGHRDSRRAAVRGRSGLSVLPRAGARDDLRRSSRRSPHPVAR